MSGYVAVPGTRRIAVVLAVALVGLSLAGCGGGSSGTGPSNTPGPNEIWMENTVFNPTSKIITAGTTITWTNKDAFNHTVTSGTPGQPDGKFASGNLGRNDTFSHTFNDVGIFQFYCSIHTSMQGTITVQ